MVPATIRVAFAAAVCLAPALAGDEPRLVYVKRATRQETIDATLAATGLPQLTGSWYYIGPFDNTDGAGFETAYPPEKEIDLTRKYPGRGGQEVGWVEAKQFRDGVVNNLNLYPSYENTCIYLYREIIAPAPTDLQVSLGSDDTISVWLHRKPQLAHDARRAAAADQERLTLHLREGRNPLLIKICNYGGPSAFYFRPALPAALETELARRLDRDFPNFAADPESKHYRIETIPIPDDVVLEVGGLAFTPDGKLLACTRRGDIYLISVNPRGDAEDAIRPRFHRWASGLHEPLGLIVEPRGSTPARSGNTARSNIPYDVVVVQRPELTRVRDSDGDGSADQFQTICDRWGVSGDYHEFAFGPARDRDGNYFVTLNVGFGGGHQSKAPWRGWCVKITPDGSLEPIASGLRSPNGVNFSPDGELFYTDNQGEWVAACHLSHIRPGRFHGHPAGLRWHPEWSSLKIRPSGQRYDAIDASVPLTPPAVWLPYGKLSQSASEPIWDTTGGAFGPFAGQCFIGDQTKSNVMRVALEKVNGVYQGACFQFRSGFQCGVNRLAFAPNSALYVGMTNRGWGSVGGSPYGLQRLTYTGVMPFEIHTMAITKSGFDLTFTKPLDSKLSVAESGEKLDGATRFSLESYTYHYWSTYGSPEIDRQPVAIRAVMISPDRTRVSLAVDGIQRGRVYELHVDGLRSGDGDALLHPEAYYTVNEIPRE